MNLNTDISNHLDEKLHRKVNFDIYKVPNPIKPESIPKFRHDTNSVYSLGLKYSSKQEKKSASNFPNPDYFKLNYKKMKNKFDSDKSFSETYAQRVLLNKNTKKNYVALEQPFPLINKVSSSQALNKSNDFVSSVSNSPMPKDIKKNLENLYKMRLMRKYKIKKENLNDPEYNPNSLNNFETIDRNVTFIDEKNIDEKNISINNNKNDFFLVDSNFAAKKISNRRKKNSKNNLNSNVKTEEEILRQKEKEEVDKIATDIFNSFNYQKQKTYQSANFPKNNYNNYCSNNITIKSDQNKEDLITPKFNVKNKSYKFNSNYNSNNSTNKKYLKKFEEKPEREKDHISSIDNNDNNNSEYFVNYSCFSSLQSNFLTQINFKKTSRMLEERHKNKEREKESQKEMEKIYLHNNNLNNSKSSINNTNTNTEDRNKSYEDLDKKNTRFSGFQIKSKINSSKKIFGDNESFIKINSNRNSYYCDEENLPSLMDITKYPFNKINKKIILSKNKELFNIKDSIDEKNYYEKKIKNRKKNLKNNKNSNNNSIINNIRQLKKNYNINRINNLNNLNVNKSQSFLNKSNTECDEYLDKDYFSSQKKTNKNFGLNSLINFEINDPNEYFGSTIFKPLDNCLDVNNQEHKEKYNTDLKAIRNKPKQFVPNFEKYKINTRNKKDKFVDKLKNDFDKKEKLRMKINQKLPIISNNDLNYRLQNKDNYRAYRSQDVMQTFYNGYS